MAGDDPEAFAVVAGKVVATGTRVDLSDRFPHDEQVDFRDAVIIPGFNDAHIHPCYFALQTIPTLASYIMADKYFIKDNIKKTAVHHNSFKDLWQTKWNFPVWTTAICPGHC